jgi:hypothetical protein
MKTKVMFLANEKGNPEFGPEIFAYFPEEPYNSNPKLKPCYAHVGQHGVCHVEYADESREATWQEYKDLYFELLGIGYDLEVIDKEGNLL